MLEAAFRPKFDFFSFSVPGFSFLAFYAFKQYFRKKAEPQRFLSAYKRSLGLHVSAAVYVFLRSMWYRHFAPVIVDDPSGKDLKDLQSVLRHLRMPSTRSRVVVSSNEHIRACNEDIAVGIDIEDPFVLPPMSRADICGVLASRAPNVTMAVLNSAIDAQLPAEYTFSVRFWLTLQKFVGATGAADSKIVELGVRSMPMAFWRDIAVKLDMQSNPVGRAAAYNGSRLLSDAELAALGDTVGVSPSTIRTVPSSPPR